MKVTNAKIKRASDNQYTASATTDSKAKMQYDGIKTLGGTTGPKWSVVADAGGSGEPSNSQQLGQVYTDGWMTYGGVNNPIIIEQPPDD